MEPSKRTLIEKELHLSEKREELEAGKFNDKMDNVKQGDHLIPRREGVAT
jgi:hypothetical protein